MATLTQKQADSLTRDQERDMRNLARLAKITEDLFTAAQRGKRIWDQLDYLFLLETISELLHRDDIDFTEVIQFWREANLLPPAEDAQTDFQIAEMRDAAVGIY